MNRIVVVGGGIVGLATAYKLLLKAPGLSVTILEKERTVGAHQTGHNSGVIHSGLYYSAGSQKAVLCTEGRRELLDFCDEFNVEYEVCGKLVVAADDSETLRLENLRQRGLANGLTGLRSLTPAEAVEYEPQVRCTAALLVPDTGIVDFAAVARALARAIEDRGGRIVTSARVTNVRRNGASVIETSAGEFDADFLITCAGLQADRVARAAGASTNLRIVPFRGDYFTLRESAAGLVRNLIYPVPNPLFPFLGVHATRSIHGHVHVGPSAALALAREGYRPGLFRPKDALTAVLFPGLWRFALRYPKLVKEGLELATSRGAFVRAIQRLIPAFAKEHLDRRESGVRAQAMLPDGRLVDDFFFAEQASAIHVLNAPSPAATASLAIGGVIATKVLARA